MQTTEANITAVKSNSFYVLLIFLLSPVLAVYLSARQYKEVWAKNIMWLFCSFYGYTFVIGNSGSDINRYKERFEFYVNMQASFNEFINLLVVEKTTDFLQPLLSYFTAMATRDFRLHLLLSGIIMGFFLSRNIFTVIRLGKDDIRWYNLLYILLFSFIFAVWDINVMRFTIAAQIFLYGALGVMVKRQWWGWVIVALSPLMHFSFAIAVAVFVLYRLLGKRVNIFFVFFILSFLVSELNLDAIKNNLTFLPKNYQEQSEGYLNEDYKEHREEVAKSKNFRGQFYQVALKYAVAILLIIIFTRRQKLRKNETLYSLFAFCLLFLGVFNVLSGIPVMNRFLFVGYTFSLALFFAFYRKDLIEREKTAVYLTTPLLLFYLIMKLRIGLEFTGLFTVLGGPVTAAFNEGDIPLISLLK